MLKSPYDTDCITWSPQGRLFQIEYAMEAIKQGSLCVGLRSSAYAVLATLNKSPSKLADYHGTSINPQRLVNKLSEKAQIKTQRHSKRPYGVGCLIVGLDVKNM